MKPSSPSLNMSDQKEQGMRRRKGFYSISVVAKMFSVHQQTIRMYEKQGLITPKRSSGNTRLFSEEDVDRLEEVIYLTHKLGVNLSGVEMILKLQKKIKRMQEEMNKIFDSTSGEFEQHSQKFKDDIKEQVGRLASIRKENLIKKHENLIEITAPRVDEMAKRPQTKKRHEKATTKVKTVHLLPEPEEDSVEDIEIEYDK
jgi:MerR family transcriptional regulator, heat shock protein HspR